VTTAPRQRRTGALAIASAPLLVAGFLLVGIDAPGSDQAGREYVSYFTDNTDRIWIGAILSVVGLAAFLAFLAGGWLPRLATAAGAAWALFSLVGVTLIAGTAGAADFFEGFTLDPDTARLMLGMSWLPSIYAGLAACVTVAATSLDARRTGTLPRGLVRAGYVAAAILFVAAFVGVASFLFPLWVLLIGVMLAMRPASETQTAAVQYSAPSARPSEAMR
jgi:hypothetical protein